MVIAVPTNLLVKRNDEEVGGHETLEHDRRLFDASDGRT